MTLAVGCGRTNGAKNWTKGEIEIAPDQFVAIEYLAMYKGSRGDASFKEIWNCGSSDYELFELRVAWNGTNVHWRTYGWPIVFRVFENKLYGVAFDRCSLSKPKEIICRLSYFAQSGNLLQEIPPRSFPKSIAIQNVMLDTREFSCGQEKRTELELARKADPNDICFSHSLTANMWYELATGKTYEEAQMISIQTNVLINFAHSNNLIRLETIIKHPERSEPSTNGSLKQIDWLLHHL